MRLLALRTRLTIWYTALLCAGLVLFSATLWLGLRSLLRADQLKNLESQAQGLTKYLQIEDTDQRVNLKSEIDEYARSLGRGYTLTVTAPRGTILYQTPPPPAGRKILSSWSNVALRGGIFSVRLAQSVDPSERALWLLGWLLAGTIPCFVCASAAVGYWLSRRALTPVDRITERALRIGVNSLSERLEVPRTGDELQRLTEAWNAMLARLEASIRQITNFTADASHELRTPVAIIRLAAENALHRARSSDEYRIALGRIQRESENMTHLIEDLLLLARADASESHHCGEEGLDLVGLVHRVCDDLQPTARERRLDLAVAHDEVRVIVAADAAGIRRILLILLDNALKYTPSGGKVLVRIARDGDAACVCVEDDGSGIPQEIQAHVFERFFRADPARHRENGGYGLGLAIAQTVAAQQHATLTLESRPAGGCIFSLHFQRVAALGESLCGPADSPVAESPAALDPRSS